MSHLVVDNVTKEYPTPGEPLKVLRGVSFEMSSGDSLAIVGPSGSGKSTLLHLIGTLDEPTSGSVTLNDEDPSTFSEPQLADFRSRRIGFIFQDHHLLPQLSVLENVLLPTLAHRTRDGQEVSRAKELIERVGLTSRIDHRPAELSGGERQRVAVARALIHRPDLLLADEPTGNLDRTTARAIGELLLDLQSEENTMLIVVTHSQELAERMSRLFELDEGKLKEKGTGK